MKVFILRFTSLIILLLSSLLLSSQANAQSDIHESFEVVEDASGNLYLENLHAEDQFVLIHAEVTVPILVKAPRVVYALEQVNGVWRVRLLSDSEYQSLTLLDSDYQIEYRDLDGDSLHELIVRASSANLDSFIVRKLSSGQPSVSAHSRDTDGIDLSQLSALQYRDINNDGVVDLVNVDSHGNPQDILLGTLAGSYYNLSESQPVASSLVGATGGEFRVAEDGSSTYQIPLMLPQGVAGVTPQVAFSYSSNAGNSTLGRGWVLSAASSISRCPKTYAIDGMIQSIMLDQSDPYCMGGQRLKLVSGEHGKANAVYESEVTDFSTVTLLTANEYGALSFKVENKAGETHYYGAAEGHAFIGDSVKPHSYLISSIVDIKNNQIEYVYSSEENHQEVNLDTITWGATNKKNTLKVNYIPNPRPSFGYRYGEMVGTSKLIQSVAIEKEGEGYFTYHIGWDHGIEADITVAENISRVNYIQGCYVSGSDESCLTPTKFTWSTQQTGSSFVSNCLEYDEGVDDIGEYESIDDYCLESELVSVAKRYEPVDNKNSFKSLPARIKNATQVVTGDVNNDGKSDIIYNDGKNIRAALSTGAGYLDVDTTHDLDSTEKMFYGRMVDIDSDGTPEFVYPTNDYYYAVSFSGVFSASRKILFDLDKYTTNGRTKTTRHHIDYKEVAFLDANGDSFIDAVYKRTNKQTGVYVKYNSAGEFSIDEKLLTSAYTSVTKRRDVKSPKITNSAFIDFNGDGISDFISRGNFDYSFSCYEMDYNGYAEYLLFQYSVSEGHTRASADEACDEYDESSAYGVYLQVEKRLSYAALQGSVDTSSGEPMGKYTATYQLAFLDNIDINEDMSVADFNGDGLSDFIYHFESYGQEYTNIALSKGDGTFTFQSVSELVDAEYNDYHRYIDINGDGKTDILVYNVHPNYPPGSYFNVYLAGHDSNGKMTFTSRASIGVVVANGDKFIIDDFSGDGKLDYLIEPSRKDELVIRYADQRGLKPHSIKHIESGFGQTTSIYYNQLHGRISGAGALRINTVSDYFSDIETATQKQRPFDDLNYQNNDYLSDFIQPNSRIWVVSSVKSKAHNSQTNQDKALKVNYKYGGMLVHKQGRGNAGFAALQTTDEQTGIVTTTRYYQQFPFVGMPQSTETSLNGERLSLSENIVDVQLSENGSLFPYIKKAKETKHHLHSDGKVSFASYTESDFEYDTFGNVKESVVGQYASASTSTQLKRTKTVNEYTGAGGGAQKGRLSKTTVTHYDEANKSTQRTSEFSYYEDGLLKSTTSGEPRLTTTYTYTRLGNKQKVCTKGQVNSGTSPVIQERCNQTNWSADERYITSATNALGQTVNFLYNGVSGGNVSGRIWSKTSTSANNIAATEFYDIQGQVTKMLQADGTQTHIERAFVSTQNLGACQLNSDERCFKETTTGSGKPTSISWYDAYGRKVQVQTEEFNGGWSNQDYTYDEYSRSISTSTPYFSGETPDGYTTYGYDVFGRVISETLPEIGAENHRTYKGVVTVYKDANGQERQETTNALGRLIQVRSADYQYQSRADQSVTNAYNLTDYHYDVFDKLIKVDNYSVNGSLTSAKTSIYTFHDDYGRKTSMLDPDKGHWRYQYNAFGEMVAQTNGEGVVTRSSYDALGRVFEQHTGSYDGFSAQLTCNVYGTDADARNVGKLINVKQYHTNSTSCSASSSTLGPIKWQQTQQFDQLGRPSTNVTTFDNASYSQTQTYDNYSRVVTQSLPGGVDITNHYADNYLRRVTQNGYLLREIKVRNAAGQATEVAIADGGLTDKRVYDPSGNGRLESIEVRQSGSGRKVHLLTYKYDGVGNLESRDHYYQSAQYMRETFNYDALYRMRGRTVNHSGLGLGSFDEFNFDQAYFYDAIGNLTQKYSDVDGSTRRLAFNYQYTANTHNYSVGGKSYVTSGLQLAGVSKDNQSDFRDYQYDKNGNVTNDGQRSFRNTAFDKPYLITELGGTRQTSRFYYGPGKARYMREDTVTESNQTVNYKTHYLGAYQRIEKTVNSTTSVEHKYHIAGAIITRKEGQTGYTRLFSHNDLQGSVVSITNQQGQVAEQFVYDPWGKKQKVIVNHALSSTVSGMLRGTVTTRGYTGHEGISQFELIHMNGRVYDPVIGRFLQADPHVQAPNNSQNYNRYSYVLNNPMSYTDPSGYFFKSLFKAATFISRAIIRQISKVPILNSLAQAAACFYGGPAGCAAYATVATFEATGSLGAAFRSGAISYATASVFKAVGGKFTGKGGFFGAGVKNGFRHILSHALVGGVSSVLRGGKFGHGFFSAGITKGLTPHFEGIGGSDFEVNGYNIAEATIAGVLGGTISQATGGKFANGAITAAMGNLFNNQGGGQKGSRSNPHGERLPGHTRIEVSKGVYAWVPQSMAADIHLARETGSTIGEYTRTTKEDVAKGLGYTGGVLATLGTGGWAYFGWATLGGAAWLDPTVQNQIGAVTGPFSKLMGPLDEVLYPGSQTLESTINNVGHINDAITLACDIPLKCN